jgi:hypothetical protein
MEQSDGACLNPWEEGARYHASGLPANMAAVLHDQWKRRRGRSGFRAPNWSRYHG